MNGSAGFARKARRSASISAGDLRLVRRLSKETDRNDQRQGKEANRRRLPEHIALLDDMQGRCCA
jgi:hypothetical protein